MPQGRNIVQAEFFCKDTNRVVRFFDETGSLSGSIIKIDQIDQTRKELSAPLCGFSPRDSWVRHMVRDWRIRQCSRRRAFEQERVQRLARLQLQEIISTSRDVAVENPDHTFRLAQRQELGDIYRDVEGSHYVWLFLFKPASLVADSVKAIAYAM